MEIHKICQDIKFLLARKIQYINQPTNEDTHILVFVDSVIAADTIFILYHNVKSAEIRNNRQIAKLISNYFNNLNLPISKYHHALLYAEFMFDIVPKYKIIVTRIQGLYVKDYDEETITFIRYNTDLYTNTDLKKILNDLLKNNIIANDYKLYLNNQYYSVSDILSNKNLPIKQSKNGNMILFHGTSFSYWKSIKAHGSLRPGFTNDEVYLDNITNKAIYLTSSFSVARDYAISANPYEGNQVILIIEVPDMDKLFPDDDYIIRQIDELNSKLITDENIIFDKDIMEMRKNIVEYRTMNYIVVNNKRTDVYAVQGSWHKDVFILAMVNNDFSIIENKIPMKNEEERIAYKMLFDLFNKKIGKKLHTPKMIRDSLNSYNSSNAVAYRGRIPLKFVLGVFDKRGNRIE